MNLSDEEIIDRLSAAGFHGASETEILSVRKDSTLLADIENYGVGNINFMLATPSEIKSSPRQNFSDMIPRVYSGSGCVKKGSSAEKRKRKAARAARKR